MNRRTLLFALSGAALLPGLARAQGVDVSAVDAYLRGLRVAEGGFRQTNPDGTVQTGRFWLSRPGRMRFEYDKPVGAMVIADGINVAVFDPKSTRVSSRYPLGRTPLSLLLRDDISLREPGMVRGAVRDGGEIDVTLVDPRAPKDGQLTLVFAEAPMALRRWVVTTKAGQATTVELTDMKTGGTVDRSLFNIELAERKKG